jgi:hypothetical protein
MRINILLILFFILKVSFSQTNDNNIVLWTSSKKLTVDDFGIKTKDKETNPSFAQFSVDYRVNGFGFLAGNFNKKIRNYMIKSASWIDTTTNVAVSLRYQQTLFNICEIYTRHFRKELKENRKKIASGTQFIDGLNQKAMTDFSNRRIVYDKETHYGQIEVRQKEWEIRIQKELDELKEFSNE